MINYRHSYAYLKEMDRLLGGTIPIKAAPTKREQGITDFTKTCDRIRFVTTGRGR